jgi:hypothetical protein
MKSEERAALRRLLASFDEAGLIALANKGLVRRAQKDLEAGGLQLEETDAAMLVRGPGWVVTMPPEGPTRATDNTRATGTTRQILTATLYLRDSWRPEEGVSEGGQLPEAPCQPGGDAARDDVEALERALLRLTLEDLQKWAGKTIFREALVPIKAGLETEIERHAGLTIRLVRQEIEARLLPGHLSKSAGTLLDAVLTTAPRANHKRWVVTAVLALQQARGKAIDVPDETNAAEASSAAHDRPQVLSSARGLLELMVATGLAHPSARLVERLCTLAISATSVHLPRLARLLRALADDVGLVLGRDAAADTGRLLERLCLAHALVQALTAAGPKASRLLVGQNRSQYDSVGDLQLVGVGAYPWQTASGYEGLTVLFWDVAGKRFLTWTTSRPVAAPGRFSVEDSYRHESVWPGGGTPERLSRSCFTLKQARVNGLGRLSITQQTSVAELGPTDLALLDIPGRTFASWRELHRHAVTTFPIGLAEHPPLDRVVVLQPQTWGERIFDELEQQFCWRLADDEGNMIQLTLPWAGVNEAAIEFLEALQPARDRLVFVVTRIVFRGKGLGFEPLSLLSAGTPNGHQVLNPGFDRGLIVSRHSTLLERLRKKFGRDRISTVLGSDDEEAATDVQSTMEGMPPGFQKRLSELEVMLLRVAEAGVGSLNELTRARFGQVAAALDRAGLAELARAVAELATEGTDSFKVIWSGFLCLVHRQAVATVAMSV